MVRGLPFDNTKRPAEHASLKPTAWSKHPAVAQWLGYADALALYLLVSMRLWSQRLSPTTGRPFDNSGMQQNVERWRIEYSEADPTRRITFSNTAFPPWWGDVRIHDSDKGILYRKDREGYGQFRRYALVYEQYVWPYQIEEQARRREREAMGVGEEVEGESLGEEEEEGFGEEKEDDGEGKRRKGKGKGKKSKKGKGATSKGTKTRGSKRGRDEIVIDGEDEVGEEEKERTTVKSTNKGRKGNKRHKKGEQHKEDGNAVKMEEEEEDETKTSIRKSAPRQGRPSRSKRKDKGQEDEEELVDNVVQSDVIVRQVNVVKQRKGRGKGKEEEEKKDGLGDGEAERGAGSKKRKAGKKKKKKKERVVEVDDSLLVEVGAVRRSAKRFSINAAS